MNKTKHTPKLIAIFATTTNNVIGDIKDGQHIMPWPRISQDMKRFRKLTEGNVVIMGRNTWDSLGDYAPLPNRTNIIVSRTLRYTDVMHHPNTYVFDSIDDAIAYAKEICETNVPELRRNVYIMGGAQIYRQTADIVDQIEVTNIITCPIVGPDTVKFNSFEAYKGFKRTETSPVYNMTDKSTGKKLDFYFYTEVRNTQ
ncbi:dihydrofolate reductase [Chryseobacterium phage MA9V-1]|nr:dihydrofolate reductase [Chryseobacterium phage MA9V-1]